MSLERAIVLAVSLFLLGAVFLLWMRRERRDDPPAVGRAPRTRCRLARAAEPRRDDHEALAAAAGMLATSLRDYLRMRSVHLLLLYPEPAALQQRLGSVAEEAALDSFYFLCRLLHRLDRLEARCLCAYLQLGVPHGDALQRLINAFVTAIPTRLDAGGIDTYNIISVLARDDASGRIRADLPVREFCEQVRKKALLREEFAAYVQWLLAAPPTLVTATEALSAYATLLRSALSGTTGGASRDLPAHPGRLAASLAPVGAGVSLATREAAAAEDVHPRPLGSGTGKLSEETAAPRVDTRAAAGRLSLTMAQLMELVKPIVVQTQHQYGVFPVPGEGKAAMRSSGGAEPAA